MHRLGREVRFSLNPFLPQEIAGHNAFASKPTGEGLALFLGLWVELTGPVYPATGFVVNVTTIDAKVRQVCVPIFSDAVRQAFRRREHIGWERLVELLDRSWAALGGQFLPARLSRLGLKLNPFRKLVMDSSEKGPVLFSEKFEFAATHRLWNDSFSEQRNYELFGKCAHPSGHGHNYIVEVTVSLPRDVEFSAVHFEQVVEKELIELVDHKNLNVDVAQFRRSNPTVENIAVFAWEKLAGKFGQARLEAVTVWETDKTYCTYRGPKQ